MQYRSITLLPSRTHNRSIMLLRNSTRLRSIIQHRRSMQHRSMVARRRNTLRRILRDMAVVVDTTAMGMGGKLVD